MNPPPYPLEITAFDPPPPWNFQRSSMRGGGMDIFWNHTIQQLGSCTWKEDRLMAYCPCSLVFRQIYYWSTVFPITIPSNWWYITCFLQIWSMPVGNEELPRGLSQLEAEKYFEWIIIIISIYTLSDLGDSSNLIGSLSRTMTLYSPR